MFSKLCSIFLDTGSLSQCRIPRNILGNSRNLWRRIAESRVLGKPSPLNSYDVLSDVHYFSYLSIIYDMNRGKSRVRRHLYKRKLYCARACDQGDQWWRQSNDMIVEYLWNAYNVKNIWHVTSSWRHQSKKKGQFLHICKFFSSIHACFTWSHWFI